MMQVVPKWKITITFSFGDESLVMFVSDNYFSNVLRKLADISFEKEPTQVYIHVVK